MENAHPENTDLDLMAYCAQNAPILCDELLAAPIALVCAAHSTRNADVLSEIALDARMAASAVDAQANLVFNGKFCAYAAIGEIASIAQVTPSGAPIALALLRAADALGKAENTRETRARYTRAVYACHDLAGVLWEIVEFADRRDVVHKARHADPDRRDRAVLNAARRSRNWVEHFRAHCAAAFAQ